jgi:hypothetical protein
MIVEMESVEGMTERMRLPEKEKKGIQVGGGASGIGGD